MSRQFTYKFVCDSCGDEAVSTSHRLPEGWADLEIELAGMTNAFIHNGVRNDLDSALVCGMCQARVIEHVNSGEWARLLAARPT